MNINPLQHFIIPQHEFPELDDHVKRIQAAAIDMTDNLIVQAITQAAKEDGVTDLYLIDKKFAADAIREKLERENPQLLTIEDLKQMNGEPVWVEELTQIHDHTGWALVKVDDSGICKGIPYVKCDICTWNVVTRNLHCYRYKPKEDHHD